MSAILSKFAEPADAFEIADEADIDEDYLDDEDFDEDDIFLSFGKGIKLLYGCTVDATCEIIETIAQDVVNIGPRTLVLYAAAAYYTYSLLSNV